MMSKGRSTTVVAFLTTTGMFALLAAGCETQPGSTANTTTARVDNANAMNNQSAKPPSDRGDTVVTGGDLAFMNEAAPGSMAEVELGRMAAKQAASNEVKQFAQQMVVDHTKAAQELMQVAQGKKVMLPQELMPAHKETMEKLSNLNGAEFDREYVKAMVAAHEKDVAAFDATAKNAVDADVKAFAAKTLPTLQMHLQMIRQIQGKMDSNAKP